MRFACPHCGAELLFHVTLGRRKDNLARETTFIDQLTLYQKRGVPPSRTGNPHRLTYIPPFDAKPREHYDGDAEVRNIPDFDVKHPRLYTTGGVILSSIPQETIPELSTDELGVLLVEQSSLAIEALSKSRNGPDRVGAVMKASANWRGLSKLDPRPDRSEILKAVLPLLRELRDEELSWTILKPYVSGNLIFVSIMAVWLAFSVSWQAYLLSFQKLPAPWPSHLRIVEAIIVASWFFLFIPTLAFISEMFVPLKTARESVRRRMPMAHRVLLVGIFGSLGATAALAAVVVFRLAAR